MSLLRVVGCAYRRRSGPALTLVVFFMDFTSFVFGLPTMTSESNDAMVNTG